MTGEKGLTALVVDDHDDSRDLLVKMLSLHPELQLNVIEAKNGIEAYDKVTKETPDILYTGIMMPGISGIELLKRLVNEKIKKPTFVVSATIATSEGPLAIDLSRQMYTDSQMEYLDKKVANADVYPGFTGIQKPFDYKEVINRTKIVKEMLYNDIR